MALILSVTVEKLWPGAMTGTAGRGPAVNRACASSELRVSGTCAI
jgi:hypothetical protein